MLQELRDQETEYHVKEEDLLNKIQQKDMDNQRARENFKDIKERFKREERLMMSAFHELALQFNRIQRNVSNQPDTFINQERKRTVEAIARR